MAAFSTILMAAALAASAAQAEQQRKAASKAAKEQKRLIEEQSKPEPPVGIPETGAGEVTKRKQLIAGGRGRTILAGQLTPANVGKKRIFG